VYKWNGSNWTKMDGALTSISVDGNGRPWGVNSARQIWAASAANTPASTAAAPPLTPRGSYLAAGTPLGVNQYLASQRGGYFAIQQADGNLCVYPAASPGRQLGNAIWCHNHVATGGQFVTAVGSDGNLCTFAGTYTSGGATWCTNARSSLGKFFLVQQDDGNLCVYAGTGPNDNWGYLWCHNTNLSASMAQPPDPAVPRPARGTDEAVYAYNTAHFSVWVTVYASAFPFPLSISDSGCVKPGGARYFSVLGASHKTVKVRAEMMNTTDCTPQPSRVLCDTGQAGFPNVNGFFSTWYAKLSATANGCSWQTTMTN
jgi:hypothetical protein